MFNPNPTLLKTKIFNPSQTDFTVKYDVNGDKNPQEFTIHAQEIEEFDTIIADHIKEHLSKEIAFKRGWSGSNFEDTKKAIEKEITVEL